MRDIDDGGAYTCEGAGDIGEISVLTPQLAVNPVLVALKNSLNKKRSPVELLYLCVCVCLYTHTYIV